jgi:hypothetical protein
MECEATRSHCEQPTGAESRVRSARGEIQTVGCEAKYACGRQSVRSKVVCGRKMIESMERSGGEI